MIGGNGRLGTPGAPGPALARRAVTIPYTALTGTAGTSKTLTSSDLVALGAFPANSVVLGGYVVIPQAFAAVGLSRLTLDLGFSGALTWFVSGQRCESNSTGAPLSGTVKTGEMGGVSLIATITTIGANMSALTAGSVTVYLYHAPATTDA